MHADSHLVLYECGWGDSIKYSSVWFILKKEHNNPNIVICFNFGFATYQHMLWVSGFTFASFWKHFKGRLLFYLLQTSANRGIFSGVVWHWDVTYVSGFLFSLLHTHTHFRRSIVSHSIYSFLISIFILYMRFVNFVNLTLNSWEIVA